MAKSGAAMGSTTCSRVIAAPQPRDARRFYTLAELSKTPVIVTEAIRAIVDDQIGRYGARLDIAFEINAVAAHLPWVVCLNGTLVAEGPPAEVFTRETLRRTYTPDPTVKLPIEFFVVGAPYMLAGVIPTDVHLFGIRDQDMGVFLLGTDRQGRDQLSRLLIGSQISLTIGLVGVFLSLLIGSVFGVASGYYGGWIDDTVAVPPQDAADVNRATAAHHSH